MIKRTVTHHARSLSTAASIPKRRSVIDLTLIGVAGIVGSCMIIWSSRGKAGDQISDMEEGGKRGVFTVPVVSQTGSKTTKTLTLLSPAETQQRLKEGEASYSLRRKNNPIFRYDSNALASNSPIEDDSAFVILERGDGGDAGKVENSDLVLFAVFDGHSGFHTSKLLSAALVPAVARELDLVFKGAKPYSDLYATLNEAATPPTKGSFLSRFTSSPLAPPPLDSFDPIIHSALKKAFVDLDNQIVGTPVELLAKLEKEGGLIPRAKDGQLSPSQMEAFHKLLPALSGSCALLGFLDTKRNKLHVACTGDSRGVMGTYVEAGKWRVDALSQDQTGKNLVEVQRIQSEHPKEERETVITRGRVLGGLEPSRAFGDARYKWEKGMVERLSYAFHPGSVRPPPRALLTPPYITACPEVLSFDLSSVVTPNKSSLSSYLPIGRSLPPPPLAKRFIVLATDGLYDRLENDEIVALVGAQLEGMTGDQTRASVMSYLAPAPLDLSNSGHTHSPRQNPVRGEGKIYCFDNSNLSTHLIENALGGASREQVSALLSIPAPHSRRYRDDITVTVILLDGASDASSIKSKL